MNLLVVGASGLVGWNFLRVARDAGHQVVGTYASHPIPGLRNLNIANAEAARDLLETFKPDAVVCCAGWSWVDGCQRDPKRAFLENAKLPSQLGRLALQYNARFLYFSTSYVFDGKDGPYDENATTNPISIYGESKLEGERLVLEATEGLALIARTMGVYGEEPQQKNFVYQVVRNLRGGKLMNIPSDQRGNASYVADLALMCISLLMRGTSGIWNVAGPEPELYRKEFALRVSHEYKLDSNLFRFITTSELGQPAPRPLQGGLKIDRAMNATGFKPSPWTSFLIPEAI
ncbi:MAG: SDR family oxidoreductase [Methylacidiphilales bacterium]|nr:SDR family oxidoreductase [Candidatus Methylacidiphilales bacterium]